MTPIPLDDRTARLARRLVWFEPPATALADPVRFMAYAFARATHEDTNVSRLYLTEPDFREALEKAPPGIIDARSWTYWNLKYGQDPIPPMPMRCIG